MNSSPDQPGAVARGFGYLVLIDLLILPYFPFFVVPYTLGITVLWACYRTRLKVDRELGWFFVLSAMVLLSAAMSVFFRSHDLVVENIKRAGQLLTSFSYYFYFRWLARSRKFNPMPLLMMFLCFHAAWTLWFLASPGAASNMASRFYPLAAVSAENNVMFYRFSYLFSDPNTNGFFVAVAGLYLIEFGGLSRLTSAFLALLLSVSAFASGSRGVLVAMVIVCGMMVLRHRRRLLRYALTTTLTTGVILMVAIVGFRYWANTHSEKAERFLVTASTAKNRLVGTETESISDVMLHGEKSAGESRMAIYKWETTHLWPLPLGRGYQIMAGDDVFRPHSDFFRMVYSYGLIACAVILWFLFRDAANYYFVIPALLAFGINTLIDEQKLLSIFLVCLALARVRRPGVKGRREALGQRTRPSAGVLTGGELPAVSPATPKAWKSEPWNPQAGASG